MKLLALSAIKVLRPRLLLYLLFIGVVLALLRSQHSLFTATSNSPTKKKILRGGLNYGHSPGQFPNVSLSCEDRACSEVLAELGLFNAKHHRHCWRKSQLEREPPHSTCWFLEGRERSPVGLASYHGSGSTWVRGLLQRATGVCTGAIYCDEDLRRRGFPGENIRSGVVLVVKTHQTDPWWTGVDYGKLLDASFKKLEYVPVYSSAILLIRSPYDAMVSEWHRLMSINSTDSRVKTVGEKYFGEPTIIKNYSLLHDA